MLKKLRIIYNILVGKSIIVYDMNTKEVVAMIGGPGCVLRNDVDVVFDRYVQENNNTIRYLGGKK